MTDKRRTDWDDTITVAREIKEKLEYTGSDLAYAAAALVESLEAMKEQEVTNNGLSNNDAESERVVSERDMGSESGENVTWSEVCDFCKELLRRREEKTSGKEN